MQGLSHAKLKPRVQTIWLEERVLTLRLLGKLPTDADAALQRFDERLAEARLLVIP